MLARAKDKLRALVAKKAVVYSKFGIAKDGKSVAEVSPTSFLKTPSRQLNDALPAEILIEIFKAVVLEADSWGRSWEVIENLSLVCRSWRDAGCGIELLATVVSSPRRMDALLGYIHTRGNDQANIYRLSATADKQKDFHRLPELLTLCRVSLRQLSLSRPSTDDPDVELFEATTIEARPDFYFPNLATLYLTNLTTREFTSLFTLAHLPRLERLELRYTFLYDNHTFTEALTSLQFPNLKEIVIQGYWRAQNPTLSWLCQSAPNLEMLEFSIWRDRLPMITEFLASDGILKKLHRPRIYIKIDRYDHLDPESHDLAPLVQLIKERGWKQWILVHISVGSWLYE
ncbi:hypothetical protein FRC01_011384 [Tulasnella sp. 417]|nr:hypothetical protein FRC01_011384 [Tulasnella sp. 417]